MMRNFQSRSALAESYLVQAVDALRSAADPRALWAPATSMYQDSILAQAARGNDAGNRRLRFLRSSVLFCAFAVEGYANCYLAEHLTPADLEVLDKLSTIDKLLTAPRVAGIDPPLEHGREPVQTLQRLFKARNGLVHPRKDSHGAFLQYLDETDEKLFGPKVAVQFIRRTAEMITLMEDTCDGLRLAGTSRLLTEEPRALDDLLAALGPTIDSVVKESAPQPADPVDDAQRRRTERFAKNQD